MSYSILKVRLHFLHSSLESDPSISFRKLYLFQSFDVNRHRRLGLLIFGLLVLRRFTRLRLTLHEHAHNLR